MKVTAIVILAATLSCLHAQEGFQIVERCTACHSGAKPAAGLNLTNRPGALAGGRSGPALIPQDAAASRIYQMAAAGKMPPGSPLSKAELASLKSWIDAGAEWRKTESKRAGPDWWSLQPLKPPAEDSIDAILTKRLAAKGLALSPPASRAILLRRATFDLHGLPPTPEEIADFDRDKSPQAWDHVIDRLLASPRYGERWARHWLDVARFCESQGYERDKVRTNIWQYRDYLIRAFNNDKPYPQFVREQLAGDVLTPVTLDGIAATAFLVAGPWDEVGNEQQSAIMKARVREDEFEDLIGTVSQTFLGLTTNCARCHDHKFDPIAQRDYYGMKALFSSVAPADRPFETPQDRQHRIAMLKPHRERMEQWDHQIATLEGAPAETRPDARFTFNYDARDNAGSLHGELRNGARVENGKLILAKPDQSVRLPDVASEWREKTFEAWVKLADVKRHGQQIVSFADPFDRITDGLQFGTRGKPRWGTDSEYDYRTHLPEGPDETSSAAFVHVAAVWSADNSIRIYRDGVLTHSYTPELNGGKGTLQTFPAEFSHLTIGGNTVGEIDEIRLYRRALTASEIAQTFAKGTAPYTGIGLAERTRLIAEQLAYRKANIDTIPQVPTIFAFHALPPQPITVLDRGDPAKPRDPVNPGYMTLQLTTNAPDPERRLTFANWIVQQPIAARVMVNRVWHYHFGHGVAGTPNDLGFNGEAPSHPELLNYLAARFGTEDGWSLKKLHRRIMLSAAYQQSGHYNETAAAQDPENRLLWRFPPKRLEGEAVRDTMLSITGMLNPEMYGESFQPFDIVIANSHFYNLKDSDEPALRRRTIYRMNVLSARLPLLESLDCPDPSMRAPARPVTTTPLQALALMNNSFVMRYAGHLARRAEQEAPGTLPDQIRLVYRLALARDPSATELNEAQALAHRQSLTSWCWTMLNSNEFVYVE
ncbi:MAG: DUF1549 domain-containing protein [Bryobacteraceae bacterium]